MDIVAHLAQLLLSFEESCEHIGQQAVLRLDLGYSLFLFPDVDIAFLK